MSTRIARTLQARPAVVHCIATLEGGGAERQLCYLAKHLVAKGWDAHVVVLRGGVNLQRLEASGATVHQIRVRNNYDPSMILKIRRIVHAVGAVVVQCWLQPMDVYGGLAAVLARRPFITVERTSPAEFGRTLKGILKLLVAQLSAAVVSNSNQGRDYWQQMIIRRVPNLVVPNIVPFEELNHATAVAGAGEYMVVIGRLSYEKNHMRFLRAVSRIAQSRTGLKVYLFGSGPEQAALQRFIADNELQSIVALSGYRDDVWSWMSGARLFVSTSVFEGLPNAVLEAAALRVPMLLSDIAAHRSYFDESCAEFVNPLDIADIARGITNALDNPILASQKAQVAFNKIRCTTGENVANDYIALYDTLAARR